jgi:hypothetical protein
MISIVSNNARKISVVAIVGDQKSNEDVVVSYLKRSTNIFVAGDTSRFWLNFGDAKSLCSCEKHLEDCTFWSSVREKLRSEFSNIEIGPSIFNQRNRHGNKVIIRKLLCRFYFIIAELTEKDLIVDVPLNSEWVEYLIDNDNIDLRIVHVELCLERLVDNWIHRIPLPENPEKKSFDFVKMKGMFEVVKHWIFVKTRSTNLKKSNRYLFFKIPFSKLDKLSFASLDLFLGLSNPNTLSRERFFHAIKKNYYFPRGLRPDQVDDLSRYALPTYKRYVLRLIDYVVNLIIR